jgi:hypothetical protein
MEDRLFAKIKLGHLGIGLALGVTCLGSPITYTGVDSGTGSGPFPSSVAAQTLFLAAIGSPTNTVTFEGAPTGFVSPQTFGIVTFTCGSCDGTISGVQTIDSAPNEDGFNTTTGGSEFYRSAENSLGGSNTVTLTFSARVTSFGAYFTGNEKFYGTTMLTFNDGASQSFTLADTGNNTAGGPGGTQFFGFTDSVGITSLLITTVNNSGARDLFGIDDVLLTSAPEPSAFGLTAAGLAALLFLRRRLMGRR